MADNRRGRATRQRLLEAAERLLAERGEDLTLEEVAAAAAVTRPTLYRHFANRDELLLAVLLRASARLAERLDEIRDAPRSFSEKVVEAVLVTTQALERDPAFAILVGERDLARTWPGVDPEARVPDAARAYFRPWLTDAVAAGVRLRADVDTSLDWLLRQTILLRLVPSAVGSGEEARRRDLELFVLPALVLDDPTGR